MTTDNKQAAMRLAGQADQVGRVSGRQLWRATLKWLSCGRLGRRRGWPVLPELTTPWQDTIAPERTGWRQRAANLDDDHAFSVDYVICRRCRLGWTEMPYTLPQYQRCGLATAGLTTLRTEHPGLSWHTLGGHYQDSRPFWTTIGAGVPGGYQQRALCDHITDF